jgi:hypothetical protein
MKHLQKHLRALRLLISSFLGAPSCIEVNTTTLGTGRRSYLADAAITTRHLLGKVGSDAQHIALVSAAANMPVGVIQDEPAAEGSASVALLGAAPGTILMVSGEAIADQAEVYSKGDGKIMDEPTTAGTYWKVGRAQKAAGAADVEIPVEPCTPEKLVIVAAFDTTDGACAAAADLAALKTATANIEGDLLALAAALATPAKLKILAA